MEYGSIAGEKEAAGRKHEASPGLRSENLRFGKGIGGSSGRKATFTSFTEHCQPVHQRGTASLTDPSLSGTLSATASVGQLLTGNPSLGRLLTTTGSGSHLIPLAKNFSTVSGVAPMKKAVMSLLQDVNVLASESQALSKRADESFEGVNDLKREDREMVAQLQALRLELPAYLGNALTVYEDIMRSALLGKPLPAHPRVTGAGPGVSVSGDSVALGRSAANLSSSYGGYMSSPRTPALSATAAQQLTQSQSQTLSQSYGGRNRSEKHFGPSSASAGSIPTSSQIRGSPGGSVAPPAGTPVLSASAYPEEVLPFGWDRRLDQRTNHFYYFNQTTGKVQWTAPTE